MNADDAAQKLPGISQISFFPETNETEKRCPRLIPTENHSPLFSSAIELAEKRPPYPIPTRNRASAYFPCFFCARELAENHSPFLIPT